jgi:UDP-2-acetamido-3-amino-2,3-dideoxy-glucuronate N-acetyltransferase
MTPDSVEQAKASGLTREEVHRVLSNLRGVGGFIDPSATVHPSAVVWHFAVVLADCVLGAGVSIGSHCEIGRGSTIGERTRIGSMTFLPPNTVIGRDTFIGPHVAMSDDFHPRVRNSCETTYEAHPPVIGDGVAIGLGAVLLPGVKIGDKARVAAGAVVTKDVAPGGFVRGEPARARTLSAAAQEGW